MYSGAVGLGRSAPTNPALVVTGLPPPQLRPPPGISSPYHGVLWGGEAGARDAGELGQVDVVKRARDVCADDVGLQEQCTQPVGVNV